MTNPTITEAAEALRKAVEAFDDTTEAPFLHGVKMSHAAADLLAALDQQGEGREAVVIEAVGTVRKWNDGTRIDWLIEGGLDALEEGENLLCSATTLTNDEGYGEVYPHPQSPTASSEAGHGECETCGGEGEVPEGFPSSFGDPVMGPCPDCTTRPQRDAGAAPVCDGKEQEAFEAWANAEPFDMSFHPVHGRFLSSRTDAARRGWKAAIKYALASKQPTDTSAWPPTMAELQANRKQPTDTEQPAPAPAHFVEACGKTDWTPQEALQFYADGKHFDTDRWRTRILDTGSIASYALKNSSPEYWEAKGGNAIGPQPAPVVPEGMVLVKKSQLRAMVADTISPEAKGRIEAMLAAAQQQQGEG